jgi:hypothetical protein
MREEHLDFWTSFTSIAIIVVLMFGNILSLLDFNFETRYE